MPTLELTHLSVSRVVCGDVLAPVGRLELWLAATKLLAAKEHQPVDK